MREGDLALFKWSRPTDTNVDFKPILVPSFGDLKCIYSNRIQNKHRRQMPTYDHCEHMYYQRDIPQS